MYQSYWTPLGSAFDVGIATRQAIFNLSTGTRPDLAGGFEEDENGNGSLMRLLPLLFYIKDKPVDERYQITKAVSSITHGHIRSVIACFYHLEFARQLLNKVNKISAYDNLKVEVCDFLKSKSINSNEISLFDRLLKSNLQDLQESQIRSSGYVLHTLEASIWCLLTTDTYKDAVLKAVNLGQDTDTTGCVTGGLAGLLYGFEGIPSNWVAQLARRDEIEHLVTRLSIRLQC